MWHMLPSLLPVLVKVKIAYLLLYNGIQWSGFILILLALLKCFRGGMGQWTLCMDTCSKTYLLSVLNFKSSIINWGSLPIFQNNVPFLFIIIFISALTPHRGHLAGVREDRRHDVVLSFLDALGGGPRHARARQEWCSLHHHPGEGHTPYPCLLIPVHLRGSLTHNSMYGTCKGCSFIALLKGILKWRLLSGPNLSILKKIHGLLLVFFPQLDKFDCL